MNSLVVVVACVVGLFALTSVSVDARANDPVTYFISYVTKTGSLRQTVVFEDNFILKFTTKKSTALLMFGGDENRMLFTKSNDRDNCYLMRLNKDKMPGFNELAEKLNAGNEFEMPTASLKVTVVDKQSIQFPDNMPAPAHQLCGERHLIELKTEETKATQAVAESRTKRGVGWGEIILIVIVIIILL